MKSPVLIAAALLLAASQADAAANIALLGQDRRATSSVFVSSPVDGFDQQQFTEVAETGGPFSADVVATAVIPTGSGSAHATQMSLLSATFVQAGGLVTAASTVADEDTQAYSFGQSNVALRFDITEATTFALSGFVEGADNGNVTVQLSRPFQTVAWVDADGQRVDVLQTGMLDADTYDLNITASASGNSFGVGTQTGLAEYSIHFALGGATDAPVIAAETVAAYPNPFRASTRLTVPEGAREVRILDASGRVVRTLTAAAPTLFDGRDAAGRPLASGVYWAQPVGSERHDALKLVHLR